jgi:hypothetical protein
MTSVPFTDLATMASEVRPRIEPDVMACLLDGKYIGDPAVTSFEREWAAYCGAAQESQVDFVSENLCQALRITTRNSGLINVQ